MNSLVKIRQNIHTYPFKYMVADEPDRLLLTRRGRAYGTTVYQRFFTNDDITPPNQGEVRYGVSHLVAET